MDQLDLVQLIAIERGLIQCRPRRRRDRSSSCSSLCATESFAVRMRPAAHAFRPPKGCRQTQGSVAVVLSFSIHLSLCSADFHRLHRYYGEIRLLHGHRPVVVASFRSTAATCATADPCRSPRVRTLNVPPLPSLLPPRPRLDFGRRVRRHANPAGPACSGLHSTFGAAVRLGLPLHTTSRLQSVASHDGKPSRAVASGSWLLPTRPTKDFHLQSSAHAGHTSLDAVTAAMKPANSVVVP